jgi:DNA-binding helix-hairpin-helix protein with protein kinase domain
MSNRESLAKRKFLDTFEIERVSISGIGPAKKAMLESYGIETAADVTMSAVMNVPGFGPALTKRLMDWRRIVESTFRFDPNAGVDRRDIAELDQRIGQTKRDLEEALRKGAVELHNLRTSILTRRQALEGPIRIAAQRLAQAEADLAVVE